MGHGEKRSSVKEVIVVIVNQSKPCRLDLVRPLGPMYMVCLVHYLE